MDFGAVLAARRSCRDFLADPIDDALLDRVLAAASLAPRAGNASALSLVVIEDPLEYWDVTLPAERRTTFRWPGLLRAPILVIPVVDPEAYVERYRAPDKVASGLGSGVDAWPVPYWWVDGGAAVMALLLAAADVGLGSLLFGQFGHESAVKARFGLPEPLRCLGTVALGWPADPTGRSSRSTSLDRDRFVVKKYVRRAEW